MKGRACGRFGRGVLPRQGPSQTRSERTNGEDGCAGSAIVLWSGVVALLCWHLPIHSSRGPVSDSSCTGNGTGSRPGCTGSAHLLPPWQALVTLSSWFAGLAIRVGLAGWPPAPGSHHVAVDARYAPPVALLAVVRARANPSTGTRGGRCFPRQDRCSLLVLVTLGLFAYNLPAVTEPAGYLDSDSAQHGIMALHIWDGLVAPPFVYGRLVLGRSPATCWLACSR